ncbi:MAG: hypothetical protein ABIH72_00275 [archaeon]
MIEMINIILTILVLVSSVPAGYLIAWLARDELVAGRKWFYLIIIASVLVAVLYSSVVKFDGVIILALVYLSILAFISLVKSRDKKWTRKRI